MVEYWITSTIESLKMLVTGQIGMDSMSGPVGIVDVVQDTYNQSRSGGASLVFLNMLNLMILLSANLGVMNLLPIPALDGGRLVFLIIEVIRGETGAAGERRLCSYGRNGLPAFVDGFL